MAITEDASAPAVLKQTGTGVSTTASFSPPSGSLLVVMASGGWYSGGAGSNTSCTISDSGGGGNWTDVVQVGQSGSGLHGNAAIGFKYFVAAPGSITVSVTWTNLTAGRYVSVKVLTGAASNQATAATATNDFTALTGTFTKAITTTATGSMVYGVVGNCTSGSLFTAAANTTELDDYNNATDSVSHCSWKSTSATGTPGSITLGETRSTGTSQGSLAEREVLLGSTSASPAPDAAIASVSAYSPTVNTGVGAPAGKASVTASAKTPQVIAGQVASPGCAVATAACPDVGRRAITGAASAVAAVQQMHAYFGASSLRTKDVEPDPGNRVITVGWD